LTGEKLRVGIFGGTFNPPHKAHVRAAEQLVREMSLDRLYVIPAYQPPHKALIGNATAEDRLEMCRLAFSHIDGCVISDIEIIRGGKSYTAITLGELSSPDTELFLFCGTDMLLTLDSWYSPEVIFSLASICYARRECEVDLTARIDEKVSEYREKFGARIYAVGGEVIPLSSTEVRSALAVGEGRELIPESVYGYITARGLYR